MCYAEALKLFLVSVTVCECVKVDVQGTLSLGKDVIDTISRFLGTKYVAQYNRRSLTPMGDGDTITEMVKAALLCREFQFSHDDLQKFVEEFIVIQGKALQNILSVLLGDKFNKYKYESRFQQELDSVKVILKHANKKVNEDNVADVWVNTVKKITVKYQEVALNIASDALQVDKTLLDKAINHKLVLASVIVEMRYLNKLCADNGICVGTYECTAGLNTVLEHLRTMEDAKVRLFIRHFYEALFDTLFYTCLSETTAHEFQLVLNDMAYSSKVPTKELLAIVQKIVAARVDFIKSSKQEKLSHDGTLLHVILSDLDHFYGRKPNPFGVFLNYFFEWTIRDETFLSKHIRKLFTEIGKYLMSVSDDLLLKLVMEVRIFLEITVDPEKQAVAR